MIYAKSMTKLGHLTVLHIPSGSGLFNYYDDNFFPTLYRYRSLLKIIFLNKKHASYSHVSVGKGTNTRVPGPVQFP
jgi:hypothetical protein